MVLSIPNTDNVNVAWDEIKRSVLTTEITNRFLKDKFKSRPTSNVLILFVNTPVCTNEMGCARCLTLTKTFILKVISVKHNESFVKTQSESSNVLYK